MPIHRISHSYEMRWTWLNDYWMIMIEIDWIRVIIVSCSTCALPQPRQGCKQLHGHPHFHPSRHVETIHGQRARFQEKLLGVHGATSTVQYQLTTLEYFRLHMIYDCTYNKYTSRYHVAIDTCWRFQLHLLALTCIQMLSVLRKRKCLHKRQDRTRGRLTCLIIGP